MDTNSDSKTAKIGILLVGHGSRLPYGKDVVSQIAEMYKENSDYLVEVGFMNISKPSIPSAINKLSKEGVEKIIVTPVFLAHGVHTKQDIPHILGLDDGHSHGHDHGHSHEEEEEQEEIEFDGEIIYTEPLGADARLVDIIKERVASAL
ncbi:MULTISPECIES: sirohydrochlorin nickelochelatase [Methanobacterium]|jgi:sirohydrochlorin cobaltochelatase|uniref:Sirohydrochlorin cobaltochelatase n=1 Tax=Methanobacterium veterum TaxID=408577 RepID=A0A9E5A8C7_9EURY|nr:MULTISPECIES: sirohydrochlorin nickelochelatase [Methanobacterium]MCZ3365501.1 sirohydrochlorin nickelochelatase [Methanobacterium veterum]MCZ3373253.1 sirohydrochlorin nickelochelatase [Methanobacterium veterum]